MRKNNITEQDIQYLLVLKDKLFDLSMFFRSHGRDRPGLYLCAASDEIEQIAKELISTRGTKNANTNRR